VKSAEEFVAKVNEVYYRTWASEYVERHVADIHSEYRRLASQVSDLTSGETTVVNIGGGAGFELELAADLGWRWKDFVLIEPAAAMRASATELAARIDQPVTILAGGVEILEKALAPSQGPRLFWINSAVHHVVWFQAFFEELGHSMRPGDRLLIGHEPRNEFARSPWFLGLATVSSIRRMRRRLISAGDNNRQDADRWMRTLNALDEAGVTHGKVPPLAVRRIVDYGVGVKRDVGRLGLKSRDDEGFWTLADLRAALTIQTSIEYSSSYRHFGDAGDSAIVHALNRLAKRVAPGSGSQFLALLVVETCSVDNAPGAV